MLPLVNRGIFQVEHDSGRAGVQHLDHEVGIIGGAGHLIALVLAPLRQLYAPAVADRRGGKSMSGLFALMRLGQHSISFAE
jgi:hypothetical protein